MANALLQKKNFDLEIRKTAEIMKHEKTNKIADLQELLETHRDERNPGRFAIL